LHLAASIRRRRVCIDGPAEEAPLAFEGGNWPGTAGAARIPGSGERRRLHLERALSVNSQVLLDAQF
jgi:hypothetical protein